MASFEDINRGLPDFSLPQPPRNAFAQYSFEEKNAVDLVWDNPSEDPYNTPFDIVGVNIYRSYDSQLGSYAKITPVPLTIGFYQDSMSHQEIVEDVSDKFVFRGDGPRHQWVFAVSEKIVKDLRKLEYGNHSEDVIITIDGVEVPAASVDGYNKCVGLIVQPYLDKLTRELVQPILPSKDSVVLCKYKYNTNFIDFKHSQRIYYKLTTVTADGCESDLEKVEPFSLDQIEAWDYVWREAVRRNLYILQQAGEDCFVMIRKWYGDKCTPCWSEVHQRARINCDSCFGTGIKGGYEGPFPFLMAPVDSDQKLDRTDQGLKTTKTGTLWTNVSPKLHTFDLIFRKSGEIHIVGYTHPSEVRGNSYLQQEFNTSLLSRERIEYTIPFRKLNYIPPALEEREQIFVTEKAKIDDGEEVRGRTVTFENISY
jgi:hypothetical protein